MSAPDSLTVDLTGSPGPTVSDMQRLNELLQRANHGDLPTPDEVRPLLQSSDAGSRGAAKHLLAVVTLREAEREAATLMKQACHDLDYRNGGLVHEAVDRLNQTGAYNDAFWTQVRAARAANRRGQCIDALVYLHNAALLDFRTRGENIGRPTGVRALADAYGTVAQMTRPQLGVQPATRHVRRTKAPGKLRLGHVCCQLVDGGHSTSRSMIDMLRHWDTTQFEHVLVITEALGDHPGQQGQRIYSPPSTERAPERLRLLRQELGIPVLMPEDRRTWLHAAADLHRRCATQEVDLLLFHGSIATPTDWLLCAWQAAPWQFDRGFGTPLYCPAVDHQFFEFEEPMEQLAVVFRDWGVPYSFSPGGLVDLSPVETAAPFSRAELAIPDDHVILGTVGNHLPERMGRAFVQTLGRVLRANPNTTYIVVGPGDFTEHQALLGADLAAPAEGPPRVRFVGDSNVAPRWTTTFDVYVNEYPGGGGIAVCEAMAAAKPVVTIASHASGVASAGTTYVGPDHVVTPATDEAFSQRLSELIRDAAARQRVGQALQRRYREQFDIRVLVRDLSERLLVIVNES